MTLTAEPRSSRAGRQRGMQVISKNAPCNRKEKIPLTGRARSVREEAAHERCGIGRLGGQCLSIGDYVAMPGPPDEATAAGGPLMLASLHVCLKQWHSLRRSYAIAGCSAILRSTLRYHRKRHSKHCNKVDAHPNAGTVLGGLRRAGRVSVSGPAGGRALDGNICAGNA